MRAREEDLRRLRDVLDGARRVHRESLRGRQDALLVMVTRVDVLCALEAFIGALEARKLPIPPRLQQEAKILHNLTRNLEKHRRRPGWPPR